MRIFLLLLVTAMAAAPALAQAQTEELAARAERARQAMGEGRFDEAAGIYAEIVKVLPDEAGMVMNLGMAHAMAGRPHEAVPHLEKALALQPALLPARLFLGMAYLETGRPEEAVAPLEAVLAADPDNTNARRMLADALLSLSRHEAAAEHLRRLTTEAGQDPTVWYGLGRSYEALAREDFEKLRDEAPESPYTQLLAAEVLAARARHAQALLVYLAALAQEPGLREAHEAVAALYEATGEAEQAAEARRKAAAIPAPRCEPDSAGGLDAGPEGPAYVREGPADVREGPADVREGPADVREGPAYVRAAECHFAAGRFDAVLDAVKGRTDEAARYWRIRAHNELAREAMARLADFPPTPERHALRAEIYRGQGRYVEAAEELKAAARLAPGASWVERQLALALYESRDLEGARALLEKLVAREPESPELAFLFGDTLLESQEVDRAVGFLERAVAGAPDVLAARSSLGRAYVQLDRPADAIPHLEAALPTDEDGALYFQLARAYQAVGRTEEARQAMARYQERQK